MTERDRHVHALLGIRAHADGCPGEDSPAAVRVEAFEVERPVIEKTRHPELDEWVESVVRRDAVAVVRCLECGGQREFERPLAGLLEERVG